MTAGVKRVTVPEFRAKKARGEKIVMLTAYDYPGARLVDPHVDAILVGDSVGTNVLGYATEVPVTLDAIVYHTQAVRRAVQHALVVADLPFGTCLTPSDGLRAAARLIQEGGADAVKVEGPKVEFIEQAAANGIPVMGHLGLLPQSVNQLGGLRVQARTDEEAQRLIEDARRLEKAGIFALVLECIPRELAREVTAAVGIPTIGIGAGPDCDGQVLIFHDMLGINERTFKHAKRYANLAEIISEAVAAYARDVVAGAFPTDDHSFHRPAK